MKIIRCEKGAAVVEYAMIIGVIALLSFFAFKMLGIVLRIFMMVLLNRLLW